MDLNPKQVHDILIDRGVINLHHANSIITSCTFLSKRALLSRKFVEDNKLCQTAQCSDDLDKKFGIWNDQFFDFVDIHARAKKMNCYGPVLFVFGCSLLKEIKKARITKFNPIKWNKINPSEWYFNSMDELRKSFSYGNFDQILVIPDLAEVLLSNNFKYIRLDSDFEYNSNRDALNDSARLGIGKVKIFPRECSPDCQCQKVL